MLLSIGRAIWIIGWFVQFTNDSCFLRLYNTIDAMTVGVLFTVLIFIEFGLKLLTISRNLNRVSQFASRIRNAAFKKLKRISRKLNEQIILLCFKRIL